MNFEYCEGRMHVIEEGDTLYQLSRQYNVPLALILRANPITDVYNLQIGDEICIPTMVGRPPERPEMPNRPQVPGIGTPEMPNRPQQPGMGMPEMPNRPQQPGMGMPEMPNRPQQPGMGMPEMPNRPQQPGMGMPGMSNRPQQSEIGIIEDESELQTNIEMPQRPTMQEVSNNLGRSNRLLTMPQFPNIFTYTIENDDSLEDILDEFEISLEDLLNFNELDDIMLLPGTTVKVPVRRDRDED